MHKETLKQKFLLYKVRQHKDADAYGRLYDFYVEKIFRFIFFKVSSAEVAEDLTSEVFLKTWEYINTTTKKIGNLNALLYKVARNCVIDHYRARRKDFVGADEKIMENIEDDRDIENETHVKLEIQSIENHLKKLKELHREAIVLRHVEELSVNEIAEILEMSNGAVRVLLHRAMKALREIAGE